MSLALLTLGLLAAPPAQAQQYPCGGSGYPGGGSGGGTTPDPGHYWKITYSSKGTTPYAIPNNPILSDFTPYSYPWNPTDSGGSTSDSTHINGNVTATLTWVPAAGKTLQSDPPSKMVSIEESRSAVESPATWNGQGPAPSPVGSADDGLGDTPVPWCSGYKSSGTHRVRKDGSSGTITLGPFTLTATNPVSTWWFAPANPYALFPCDWIGGLCGVSFGVEVVPPAHPVNFRCVSAITYFDGILHYEYAWDSSTNNLADLDGCTIKERVSYEGNSTGTRYEDNNGNMIAYSPPAPFAGRFANPEIYGAVSGTQGFLEDDHLVLNISPPYQPASFTATQNYIYTDDTWTPTTERLRRSKRAARYRLNSVGAGQH